MEYIQKLNKKLLHSTKPRIENHMTDEPSTSRMWYHCDTKSCILSEFELHDPLAVPLLSPQTLMAHQASGRQQLTNLKPSNILKEDEEEERLSLEAIWKTIKLKKYLYSERGGLRLRPPTFLPWRWSERSAPASWEFLSFDLSLGDSVSCWKLEIDKLLGKIWWNHWLKRNCARVPTYWWDLHFPAAIYLIIQLKSL